MSLSVFESINKLLSIFDSIYNLPKDAVSIAKTIECNPSARNNLIIIPGFSQESFDRNYQTLFELYSNKINKQNFNLIHLVKFSELDVRKLHQSFFTENNEIIDPALENALYEKCASLLASKLDSTKTYSVLAKSAGAGPAIYLCQNNSKQIKYLYLFAPGVKFIHQSIAHVNSDFAKTLIGWNKTDTKVKCIEVWPNLESILPTGSILITFDLPNQSHGFDTQHEINTDFFDKVI